MTQNWKLAEAESPFCKSLIFCCEVMHLDIIIAFLCILAKFMVCIHHSHKQLVISAVVLFSHHDVQMLCFCTQLRSLKCAEKTKSPSLELLVFTHDISRAHQGNRRFASNRQLGDKKVMTRQFLPSEVSRVECCGQSVSQSLALSQRQRIGKALL